MDRILSIHFKLAQLVIQVQYHVNVFIASGVDTYTEHEKKVILGQSHVSL